MCRTPQRTELHTFDCEHWKHRARFAPIHASLKPVFRSDVLDYYDMMNVRRICRSNPCKHFFLAGLKLECLLTGRWTPSVCTQSVSDLEPVAYGCPLGC